MLGPRPALWIWHETLLRAMRPRRALAQGLPHPHPIMYTYVATALIAALLAGTGAWRVQAWRFDSERFAAQVNARATERMRRQNADTAAVAYETGKAERQVEFITINEKVEHEVQTERVVYERTCIAPGGLQQLADAVRATADPGQPGSPVPAASAPR